MFDLCGQLTFTSEYFAPFVMQPPQEHSLIFQTLARKMSRERL